MRAMNNLKYFEYVKLLLKVLPSISMEKAFALKGGTAINLFLRNLPRLSIDIDLTYLPLQEREESFIGIYEGLKRIKFNVEKTVKGARVTFVQVKNIPVPTSLVVSLNEVKIKVETNLVLRGSVFNTQTKELCFDAQNVFEIYTDIQTLSDADIYGGKICAALDRQHPRDLFDVKVLLDNEGITDDIRKAFVVYLASHSRPMNELLSPNFKDISTIYEQDFVGMTTEPIELISLLETRERLVSVIKSELTNEERLFLISMKEGSPKWELLELEGIEKLPGLQWKLNNIKKMDKEKRALSLDKLKLCLEHL
jgi:predicted nucleotidyltransferase component of viral defense system